MLNLDGEMVARTVCCYGQSSLAFIIDTRQARSQKACKPIIPWQDA